MPLVDAPITLPASLFIPKGGYNIIAQDSNGEDDFANIITFDLLVKERHGIETEISNQPIEKGSDLSYHVKQKLQKGSLTGFVSNWGLYNDSFLTEYTGSLTTGKEQRPNRVKIVWDLLMGMAKSMKRMKIVTSLAVYDDVIITNVEADRDPESGEAQEISVGFQQLNIVTLKREVLDTTVRLDETKSVATKPSPAKQSAPKKSAGRVTPAKGQVRSWGATAQGGGSSKFGYVQEAQPVK